MTYCRYCNFITFLFAHHLFLNRYHVNTYDTRRRFVIHWGSLTKCEFITLLLDTSKFLGFLGFNCYLYPVMKL